MALLSSTQICLWRTLGEASGQLLLHNESHAGTAKRCPRMQVEARRASTQ